MREIVGFVMGAAAGAAGALFMSSAEGRALVERLRAEARPEVERAATEWEPVIHEVARAVRLAARELETATADLRSRIAEIAAAPPTAEGGGTAAPGTTPGVGGGAAPVPAAEGIDVGPPAADAVATTDPAPDEKPSGAADQPGA